MGKLEPVDPVRVEELRNMVALGRDEVAHASSAVTSAQERREAAMKRLGEVERELGAYVYPPAEAAA